MPNFRYRGRDSEGNLRSGQRFSITLDALNLDLIREGIYPIEIAPVKEERALLKRITDWFRSESFQTGELAVFARQMELLQAANIPMVTALKQMASHTRSDKLAHAINGLIEGLEKGQSLAVAMQNYPEVFSPLIVNIIQIGETTGHLGEAFANVYRYLEFESGTLKQLKGAFRYPLFVLVSIGFAIIILNVFVIPTFANFYVRLAVDLPWQTRILINLSNFFVHYGLYLLVLIIIAGIFFYRYIKTPSGRYRWDYFKLRVPVFGKLLNRVLLIRFCQSLSIVLSSGIPIIKGFVLVKNVITNQYILDQIDKAQELIERGVSFTQAITQVQLFSTLEVQILSVGERSGNLPNALNYIADFHSQEVKFEIKKINDIIGPLIIVVIAILVLIMALGVYLPIWNMINLVHA